MRRKEIWMNAHSLVDVREREREKRQEMKLNELVDSCWALWQRPERSSRVHIGHVGRALRWWKARGKLVDRRTRVNKNRRLTSEENGKTSTQIEIKNKKNEVAVKMHEFNFFKVKENTCTGESTSEAKMSKDRQSHRKFESIPVMCPRLELQV